MVQNGAECLLVTQPRIESTGDLRAWTMDVFDFGRALPVFTLSTFSDRYLMLGCGWPEALV